MLFSFERGGDNGTNRSILYYRRLGSQKNKINLHFLCCLLANIYLIFDMNIYMYFLCFYSIIRGGKT
jgi:hypothetical protein